MTMQRWVVRRRAAMEKGRGATFGVLVCLAGWSHVSHATGFFVNQQSVVGLGRVNAGASAVADDPSTIAFNPAGLPTMWESDRSLRGADTWVMFGVQVLVPRARLVNEGSLAASPGTLGVPVPYGGGSFKDPGRATPVPNFFVAHRVQPDFHVGLGVTFPFGLSSEFSDEWFGRYDAIEASLKTVNVSAVVATRLTSDVHFGAGIDAQYAHTKLVTAVPNPFTPGGPSAATDARSETRGKTWTPGFNIGVMWHVDPATRVGLHYRSRMRHSIDGVAITSGLPGPLAAFNGATGAKAKLELPDIVNLGIAMKVSKATTLLGQVEWYGWKKFDEIRVRFDDGRPDAVRRPNFRNSWAIAVGADYQLSDRWTIRGGLRFDRTPTRDGFRDTTFPDGNRIWVGSGATYRFDRNWRVDFALKHAFFEEGKFDVTRSFFEGSVLESSVRVKGRAKESSVTTLSVNVGRAF
jgi:long-chain fatty acid transport protein